MFFTTISTSKKMFSFRARAKKRHCATHWRERRGWDLVIFYWFVLGMRMQVILDFPGLFFRPPGFSPYIGQEERKVQGLDYFWRGSVSKVWQLWTWNAIPKECELTTTCLQWLTTLREERAAWRTICCALGHSIFYPHPRIEGPGFLREGRGL